MQLADALELDEIESARYFLGAQDDLAILDRPNLVSGVIRFHERRQYLVECLRLVLRCVINSDDEYSDSELDEQVLDTLRLLLDLILDIKDGTTDRNGSLSAQKCLGAMEDIEKWLQVLGDRYQGSLTLGQPSIPEYDEIMRFQQRSLEQQHESLAVILTYLIKQEFTGVEDFYKLLEHLPKLDRWNNLTAHYIPIILAFVSRYGTSVGRGSLREARTLNMRIAGSKDSAPWALRNLQAATIVWWLAEYSGWYTEQPVGSPVQGVDLDAEAVTRSDILFQALRDGAFQCILSICSQIRPNDWPDQMRTGLTQHLLRETPALVYGAAPTSDYFQDIVMEHIEVFADAFIANMPDTIRRFRSEEDDQRKRINSTLQPDMQTEQDLHLERFLLIIAYAFENRPGAAEIFWADNESNLFGFLQWASKRQSTPRVGAFCEMLRSISQGETCADKAHEFLLDESGNMPARLRRSSSLNWAQIIAELTLYTSRISDHSVPSRPANQYISRPISDDIDEPESALMLECYLRLTSHICSESAKARSWVLFHPSFHALDIFFLLCSNTVPSRLRASAFSAIRALTSKKTPEIGMMIWNSLDQWTSGGNIPISAVPRPAKIANASTLAEDLAFDTIANDVDESSEFVGLLQSLIEPPAAECGLNDSLPFPEQLGSAHRMSGIDPYIDCVFGKIFTVQVHQLENSPRLRLLRLRILNFASTCLESFNENLLVLANKSTLPVDVAMRASSLQSYVRLHPFSRVMEWLFNERVLAALFSAAHQDIEEVSSASPNSPLILSVLRSIDVMNLIIELQSTYLDIVRPLTKSQFSGHRREVLNPSLASFEDSVATNLYLVTDLGLYCGAGMRELTLASLKLLEKLASSRKLNVQSAPGLSTRLNGNRLIGVLEQNNDLERIAKSFILAMQVDHRELSEGVSAPGWTIKSVILGFLNNCLVMSPDKPSLAHALLGFHCKGVELDIEAGGLFARGTSLFHAVLQLVVEYPGNIEDTMQSWALNIKQKAFQVISTLWASPLTSIVTLSELRQHEFLFAVFLDQVTVEPSTRWDDQLVTDPEFIYSSSALAFELYLKQRCYLYKYTGAELMLIAVEGSSSQKARSLSTILGSTSMPNGEQQANSSILELLDFIELDIFNAPITPTSTYFAGLDFTIAAEYDPGNISGEYNIKLVEQIMALHLSQIRKSGVLQDITQEQCALEEGQSLLLFFEGMNNYLRLSSSRSRTLKAWVDLLALVIKQGDLDQDSKTNLILQSFQVLVPKLEKYVAGNMAEAIEVATLIYSLLYEFDFNSSVLEGARAGDVASERLFQIFRTALRAIHAPDGEPQFREILYNICYRYLTGMAENPVSPVRRRYSIQTVKGTGEKLIDIICDDAHGGSGTCRVSALLLLDSLVALARAEKSNYMIDSLMRTNFMLVLVESIQGIPQELRETSATGGSIFVTCGISILTVVDIPILLSCYESKFSLLLSIAQTRVGAVNVMNSGLFQAIVASGLFSVDPDIGVGMFSRIAAVKKLMYAGIDNPEALSKYYRLLLSITSVVTCVVITRGPHNEQTIDQTRWFLDVNRASIVGIFKRQSKIGVRLPDDAAAYVDELVELYVLLFTMTGFLEVSCKFERVSC